MFYRAAFGFQLVAYRGPETGTRDRASYVLEQDKVRFVLTTPLGPDGPDRGARRDARRRRARPRALGRRRAATRIEMAVERGARPVQEPTVLHDDMARS